MIHLRRCWFTIAGCLITLASPLCGVASEGRTGTAATFENVILPLVRAHCFDCHGNGEASGSVDLEAFSTFEDVVDGVQLWESIATVVADGEMPPEDSDSMTAEQRQSIVDFSRQVIDLINRRGQTDVAPTMPRRLTRREYVNTVRDLLGVTIDAETFLPEDKVGATGFRNDATELTVPPELLEKYLLLADKIVAEAMKQANSDSKSGSDSKEGFDSNGQWIPKRPGNGLTGEAAADELIRDFGKQAFRRPLSNGEVEQYMQLYRTLTESDADFDFGVAAVMKAMLVSPYFLFRLESAGPNEGVTRISEYELASRLSYLLWASMPDDRLMNLADEGRLSEPETLAGEVHRMLADDRAVALAEEFAEQWLFSRLTSREPDYVVFPNYTQQLDTAVREELKRFITHLFRADRSLMELIDSDYIFVNGVLAEHYGIRLDESGEDGGDHWRRISLSSDDHRGGLLGMARVLQRTSMSDRTSPTVRGAWVLDAILGTPPPPPPPDVNNTIDESNSGEQRARTFREKLALHANDGNSCAGCHKKMDPIGFAMDNYDAIGQWRTTTLGLPIDTSGATSDGRELDGVDDVKQWLLDRKSQFARNLARQFLVYALGRPLTGDDFPSVNAIVREMTAQDFRASALVLEVVQSFPFNHKKYPVALAADR